MRIAVLISAHVVCDLVAVLVGPLLGDTAWAKILFSGLVTSQLCLLGVWLGFGRSRWYWQLMGTVGGTATVCAVVALASRSQLPMASFEDAVFAGLIALAAVLVTAASCIALRRWWLTLEQIGDGDAVDNQARFRFTLGQLLGLPCFYAILVCTGQIAASAAGQPVWVRIIVPVFLALSLIAVPVVAVWSALGRERLSVRIVVGLAVSSVHGLLPPAVLKLVWWQAVNWMLLYLTSGVFIFASLLVVRSNGYRVTFRALATGSRTAREDHEASNG